MLTGDANRSVRAETADRIEAFLALRSQPSSIRLADKLLFCLGVAYVPATEWVMIVLPHRFSYWYTASILLALSWRAHVFTAKKWHYSALTALQVGNPSGCPPSQHCDALGLPAFSAP